MWFLALIWAALIGVFVKWWGDSRKSAQGYIYGAYRECYNNHHGECPARFAYARWPCNCLCHEEKNVVPFARKGS